jgi:hypothetical protein
VDVVLHSLYRQRIVQTHQPHLRSTAAKISKQKSPPNNHIQQPPHTNLFLLILLNSAFSTALERVLLNEKVTDCGSSQGVCSMYTPVPAKTKCVKPQKYLDQVCSFLPKKSYV